MADQKRDPKPDPNGFVHVAVNKDLIDRLNVISDDITEQLGIRITRSQALTRVIHFYETHNRKEPS